MALDQPKRQVWESALLVIVFLGMLAFIVNSYFLEKRVYEQKVLRYQLENLRQGITLYQYVERKTPESLVDLSMATFRMPDSGQVHHFIARVPVSKEGKFLDPFGNPYAYDKAQGWVSSSTGGYASW